MITVSEPPSSGKTSVILQTAQHLKLKIGVVKFDCLTSFDRERYAQYGIEARVGFSGKLCPDHFFISNIQEAFAWGKRRGFDILITESAGLCNRCSPHIRGIPAICVIDNLSGINTPRKLGPMLKFADIVVVTKGDIVSQAEREVFAYDIRQMNSRAQVLSVNGVTGQGAFLPCAVRSSCHSGGAYNVASVAGIPSVLIERGCMGRWNREEVDADKADVINLLRAAGMIEGKPAHFPKDFIFEEVIYEDAPATGLWYPDVQTGNRFHRGERLGVICDYLGKKLHEVIAKTDGLMLYQTSSLNVLEKGPMVAYGVLPCGSKPKY